VLPGRFLEENQWRAIRFGLDGDLIDYGRGLRAVPAAERIRNLLAEAAPEIRALGLEPHLRPLERMLDEGNPSQRLIRMLQNGASLEEAFAAEVRTVRESTFAEVGEPHG
jgi:carboxylate-amine ligase